MSDFEREIVQCLNRFFRTKQIQGFAYRPKPQKFPNRYGDVLTDSPDSRYNLLIECTSIIDKKLYFSQHFHADKQNVHPVDTISDYLAKTGRTGFLAIEFRQEAGNPGEAFLIPWETIVEHFRNNRGIAIEDARNCIEFGRSKEGYVLEHV